MVKLFFAFLLGLLITVGASTVIVYNVVNMVFQTELMIGNEYLDRASGRFN